MLIFDPDLDQQIIEAPEVQQGPGDLEFLIRGLQLGEGFQLYFVGINSFEGREALATHLEAIGLFRVAVVHWSEERTGSIVSEIIDAFAGIPPGDRRPVVVLTEIEQLVSDNPSVLNRLNEQRNRLIRESDGAVIILSSTALLRLIMKTSPDTWSVRAADVYFGHRVAVTGPSSEDWRPAPNRPPSDAGEATELRRLHSELPPGDRRGRVALRLAEVGQFEDLPPRDVADLYLEAAQMIEDGWFSILARASAGIALANAGEVEMAFETFETALESALGADPLLQAAINWRLATVLLHHSKELDKACTHAERAVHLAVQAGSRADMAEYRYTFAICRFRQGQFQEACDLLADAAEDAEAVGNSEALVAIRGLAAAAATMTGHPRRAVVEWERLLGGGDRSLPETWEGLLASVEHLDKIGAVKAADSAWQAIRRQATEVGVLASALVRYTRRNHTGGLDGARLECWQARLKDLGEIPWEGVGPVSAASGRLANSEARPRASRPDLAEEARVGHYCDR